MCLSQTRTLVLNESQHFDIVQTSRFLVPGAWDVFFWNSVWVVNSFVFVSLFYISIHVFSGLAT